MTKAEKTEKVNKKTARSILKPRYKFFMGLTRIFTYPIVRFKYRAKIEKFKGDNKRNYLILFNHQTPFDQFFVLSAFKGVIRLVSSEDVSSNGFLSRILSYCYGIIPIKKQTSDTRAVMESIKIAKAGGSIAVAPEGNRTYSGETCYINPSIAAFIKALKLPVVFFKIRGGYGVEPRWSDVKRKGKMLCGVTRVMEYDEYKDLSKDELYFLVKSELYQNESDDGEKFYSKKSAEKLERLLYVCPYCSLTEFKSKGDTVTCKTCNRKAVYGADKRLTGDFPFNTVLEWYRYQEKFIVEQDLNKFKEVPAFKDRAKVSRVIPYKKKIKLFKSAEILLFGDRIEVKSERGDIVMSFNDVTALTVLGRNKFDVYIGENIYQIKGDKSFNAIKYMHFKNIYSQKEGGKKNDFFFGI